MDKDDLKRRWIEGRSRIEDNEGETKSDLEFVFPI